eukprot:g2148.t1
MRPRGGHTRDLRRLDQEQEVLTAAAKDVMFRGDGHVYEQVSAGEQTVPQPVLSAPVAVLNAVTAVPGRWTSGLFDCCDDLETCCWGTWCTACLYGQNAQKIDGSSCPLCCVCWSLVSQISGGPCLVAGPKRSKMRAAYALPPTDICCCGEEFDDFVVHCLPCTMPCAVCQEARELQVRGAAAHCPAAPPVTQAPAMIMAAAAAPPAAAEPGIMMVPTGGAAEPVIGVPVLGVPLADAAFAGVPMGMPLRRAGGK